MSEHFFISSDVRERAFDARAIRSLWVTALKTIIKDAVLSKKDFERDYARAWLTEALRPRPAVLQHGDRLGCLRARPTHQGAGMVHRLDEISAVNGEEFTPEEALLLLKYSARIAVQAGHHPAQIMVAAMHYAENAVRSSRLDVAEASAVRH